MKGKAQVPVHDNDGNVVGQEVDGVIIGAFIIHRPLFGGHTPHRQCGFKISHVLTGFGTNINKATKREAIRIAKILAEIPGVNQGKFADHKSLPKKVAKQILRVCQEEGAFE
jgi:hypothetical protein